MIATISLGSRASARATVTFCWLPPDSSPTGWSRPAETSDSAARQRRRRGGAAPAGAASRAAAPAGRDGHRHVLGDAEHADEALALAVLRDVADAGLQRDIPAAGRSAARPSTSDPARLLAASAPATTRAERGTPGAEQPGHTDPLARRAPQRDVRAASHADDGRGPRARRPGTRARRPARSARRRARRGRRPVCAAGAPQPTIAADQLVAGSARLSARSARARRHGAPRRPGRSRRPPRGGARCRAPRRRRRRAAAPARTAAATASALERRGRLVEQQAPGAGGQRPGDLDDLRCSTVRSGAVRARVDLEAPLGHDCASASRIRRQSTRPPAAGLAAEEDVLGDGELRHHHRVLEDRRDPLAPGVDRAERRRRLAVEAHLAASGRQSRTGSRRASTCRRRCGRPGPRHRPGSQREIDTAQRLGAAEALVDAVRLHERPVTFWSRPFRGSGRAAEVSDAGRARALRCDRPRRAPRRTRCPTGWRR